MKTVSLVIDDKGCIEVAFNAEYGGFGLSEEAINRMIELGSEEAKRCYEESKKYQPSFTTYYPRTERCDPILIRVIKELKNKASGQSACLAIGKVHFDSLFQIKEFDGRERIEGCYDYKVYGRYNRE